MNRTTDRRFARVSIGLAVGVLCIILIACFPAHGLAVQVVVWSLILVAILLGENYMHFREQWFWKACLLIAALHAVVLAVFWRYLPFPSVGVAMLMSFAEALACLIIIQLIAGEKWPFRK